MRSQREKRTQPPPFPPPHPFRYAGKKLRKWYGQEGQVLPRDGRPLTEGEQPPGEEEEQGDREYVAVLDADSSPMAEQVGDPVGGR